jgi:hypothetical protein
MSDWNYNHLGEIAHAPRVIYIGPEAFWDQAGEWTLGPGSFQLKRTLGDHTAQRSLYATLQFPNIKAPDRDHRNQGYSISKFNALVKGSGFTGVPATPARLQLMSPARGVILSVNDPAVSTGILNISRAFGREDTDGVPFIDVTDPEDPLLVEFDSPFGGSGYGTFEFHGVYIKLVTRIDTLDLPATKYGSP